MCVLSACSEDGGSKGLAAALRTCIKENTKTSAVPWQNEEQQDDSVGP